MPSKRRRKRGFLRRLRGETPREGLPMAATPRRALFTF